MRGREQVYPIFRVPIPGSVGLGLRWRTARNSGRRTSAEAASPGGLSGQEQGSGDDTSAGLYIGLYIGLLYTDAPAHPGLLRLVQGPDGRGLNGAVCARRPAGAGRLCRTNRWPPAEVPLCIGLLTIASASS